MNWNPNQQPPQAPAFGQQMQPTQAPAFGQQMQPPQAPAFGQPAPAALAQPQAVPGAPPSIATLFAGFADATVEGRHPKMLDADSHVQSAQFRLRFDSCDLHAREGYNQFLIEATIIETSHPERGQGQTISWSENKIGKPRGGHEIAMGNIKGLLAAAISHKLGRPVAPTEQQDWMGIVTQVVQSKGELLRGCEFLADAHSDRAKPNANNPEGAWFIRTNFRPVPELFNNGQG